MDDLIKVRQLSIGEIFYLLSFAPLLFAKGIGLYDGQRIFTLFVIMAFIFGLLKLLTTKYSSRDLLLIGVLTVLSLIVYKRSCEKGILFYTWMVVGLKDVRLKEVMRWGLKIWSVAFPATIIYSLFHLHDTLYKVHDKLGLGHIFRWALGYPHPNVLHISYLILLLFIVYHLRERFDWKVCVWMFLGNCYVFLYSISYTGFAIVTVYLLANLYWKYCGRFGKIERVICECIFPACVLLSIAGPLVLKGKAFDIVNKLLNTRLYLSGLFLKKENIRLFGNNIGLLTNAVKTMDSSYVYGLIAYGAVVFGLIVAGYLWLIHKYVKEQKVIELLMIFAMLAAGLTEPFLFNTSYKNISLLFIGEYIFNNGGLLKEKFRLGYKANVIGDIAVRVRTVNPEGIGQRAKKVLTGQKIYFGVLSAVIGCVCMILYVGTAPDHKGVIVPRVHCADVEKGSSIYLEDADMGAYDGYLILDHKDKETPMELFEGNILKLEMIRGITSSGLLGWVASYYLLSAVYLYFNKNKGEL